MNFDEWLASLASANPSVAAEVENFYFPNPDGPNRGVPAYSGASSNAYANINPNAYAGLSAEDFGGDKLYADLIRAQTQDYLTRFAPVENFLASEITATGTKALEGDLARTRQAVLGASQNVQGMRDRSLSRFGLSTAPSNTNNMNTVGALVGGLNETRLRDADRREQLLSGGMGGITQNMARQGRPS